jgi:hypothetical protein
MRELLLLVGEECLAQEFGVDVWNIDAFEVIHEYG